MDTKEVDFVRALPWTAHCWTVVRCQIRASCQQAPSHTMRVILRKGGPASSSQQQQIQLQSFTCPTIVPPLDVYIQCLPSQASNQSLAMRQSSRRCVAPRAAAPGPGLHISAEGFDR